MLWLYILIRVVILGGAIYGFIWTWRNGYISWEIFKEYISWESLKEVLINMFSQPKFILLYILFVLFPVWVITDWLHSILPIVPIWQKLLLSIAGIWMVDRIMIVRNVEG